MSRPAKFLFDQSFDRPGERRAEPRTPTFSAGDMDAAVQSAYARGLTDGVNEAKAAADHELLSAMRRLGEDLSRIATEFDATMEKINNDAAALAFAIARRLAGQLVDKFGAERVRLTLMQCLAEMKDEPRIVLRAAENILEQIKPVVDQATAATGFQGHVVLLPDETMAPTDCKIEWADGGASIDQGKIEKRLSELLRNAAVLPPGEQ